MPYTDFAIVCGLSQSGGYDGTRETDWYKLGIPVKQDEIWELSFLCGHKAGAPDAAVVGSFVMYGPKGVYRGTTPGSIEQVNDAAITSTNQGWVPYVFDYKMPGDLYVFPAIWWHAATALQARYVCAVQMARAASEGNVEVVTPDVYLTLGTTDPLKELANVHAHLGPHS
jgi:hypothetical protein